MTEERNTSAQVLGTTRRPRATGDHQINWTEVTSPFNADESAQGAVAHLFCCGCGNSTIVTDQGLTDLLQLAGQTDGNFLKGEYFFLVGRCLLCDTHYQDVELRSLKNVLSI